jgi:hypothetical protein
MQTCFYSHGLLRIGAKGFTANYPRTSILKQFEYLTIETCTKVDKMTWILVLVVVVVVVRGGGATPPGCNHGKTKLGAQGSCPHCHHHNNIYF